METIMHRKDNTSFIYKYNQINKKETRKISFPSLSAKTNMDLDLLGRKGTQLRSPGPPY